MMMQRGEHLTSEGIQKIVNIRASLNKGLTPLLLEAFPNTVAVARPLLPLNSTKLDPQWIAGFTSGDGCFKVSIRESKLYKAGSRVVLLLVVTQHIRDECAPLRTQEGCVPNAPIPARGKGIDTPGGQPAEGNLNGDSCR